MQYIPTKIIAQNWTHHYAKCAFLWLLRCNGNWRANFFLGWACRCIPTVNYESFNDFWWYRVFIFKVSHSACIMCALRMTTINHVPDDEHNQKRYFEWFSRGSIISNLLFHSTGTSSRHFLNSVSTVKPAEVLISKIKYPSTNCLKSGSVSTTVLNDVKISW